MQIALFQLKGSSKYFTAQLARELLLPNFTFYLSTLLKYCCFQDEDLWLTDS